MNEIALHWPTPLSLCCPKAPMERVSAQDPSLHLFLPILGLPLLLYLPVSIASPALTLKPVGHQSTNWIVLLVLMAAMATFTSLGTTSPL